MALARFFDRVYTAAGRHLSVSRDSLEKALGDRVVSLQCGSECNTADNPRWIAELLVNQFARLYPRLAVSADGDFADHLRALARDINPDIVFEDSTGSPVVVVGTVSNPPSGAIFPSAQGWVAHLHSEPPRGSAGPANPFAAAAAACFAADDVFRTIFFDRYESPVKPPNVDVSLLDFSSSAGQDRAIGKTDLGEVAFVGIGAVGNPAIWTLTRYANLSGTLWLVDPESVDLSNLQRYVLPMDADIGMPKVELAARALSDTALHLELRPQSLEEFAESFGERLSIPTVCVSVDNIAGRRTAQALLPRLVVNGWTSDSGLGASWHIFDSDTACLSCLYHPREIGRSQTEMVADAFGLPPDHTAALWVTGQPPTDEDIKKIARHLGVHQRRLANWRGLPISELYSEVICGAIPLDVEGVGHVESVPLVHQSTLAGVLMAAELVKRLDPELSELSQTETLVVWDDVHKVPPSNWLQPRQREPGCICGDPIYQNVYADKWRTGSL